MANRLFLVHGMGKHPPGWETPVVATLREVYGRYRVGRYVSFDERFEVVPVRYDDLFTALLEQWQQDAASLTPSDGVSPGEIDGLVGWLRDVDPEDFVWSHAADAMMYRLFADVRQAVKTTVASQIAARLVDLGANETWSVLGYSLGTAVAHDALDMLWTGELPPGGGFDPAELKAQLVMMTANVSRVMETTPPVLESTVRPGDSTDPEAGCFHYLNVFHDVDPFTIPRRFNPPDWPDADAIADDRYWSPEVAHIHQVDIHDWSHYLLNPAVHIPMLRWLTFPTAVTQQEEAHAYATFEPWGDLGHDAAMALRAELEEIAPSLSDVWARLPEIWDRFTELRET